MRRRGFAILVSGCLAVATCVYPTEHDASVRVTLTPLKILIQGRETVAVARAWHIPDSLPIPNVAFVWSSSDSSVVTVDAGRIVGIKSGTAVVRAAALNFDKGQLAAADTIRVSAPPHAGGCGERAVWPPPPAESDRITFIGNGIVTQSADSTHVIKRDVYEPNDTAPHKFDLDAPRPFPYPGTAYNLLLVYNPALFFEPLKRGATFGADWYRFHHATTR